MSGNNLSSPPVFAAKNVKSEYLKPSFEVVEVKIESPLLQGSGGGTAKKIPVVPDPTPGNNW